MGDMSTCVIGVCVYGHISVSLVRLTSSMNDFTVADVTSSSSAFSAVSLAFTILGEIFSYVTVS